MTSYLKAQPSTIVRAARCLCQRCRSHRSSLEHAAAAFCPRRCQDYREHGAESRTRSAVVHTHAERECPPGNTTGDTLP